jgi:hypothetical protein
MTKESPMPNEQSLPPPRIGGQEIPPVPYVPAIPAKMVPGDLPADADGKLPFWKPTWGEVAMKLGWRWLFVGPAILLTVGGTWMCIWSWWWSWWWRWEWAVLLLMGAVGGVVGVIRQAIKVREEPFCIHCGYSVEGLPDHHLCPECGRKYSLELIRVYQQDPRWFIQCWENEQVKKRAMAQNRRNGDRLD